jgi:hypothetical protein
VASRLEDREELERFKRDINLSEFAAARGYRVDRSESSRGSVVMRHPATDDKIIIARRSRDLHWTYFSVRDDRDNGSIIDFVQRRGRTTLGELRKELRVWTGSDRPKVSIEHYVPTLVSPERDRGAVARLFAAARSHANSPYLNSRGIRPETLAAPRFRSTFRVDHRGNVLFPHRDGEGLCGFEAKNHRWTSFSPGGRKTLWLSQVAPTDARLVLVESAIDALSHYQLAPTRGTRYGSTGGEFGAEALEVVRTAIADLPAGGIVVTAFDADAGGDKLAAEIEAAVPGVAHERERPPLKDWNDVLKKKEHAYIAALGRGRGPDRGDP